jgi:hypothetical protein
VPAPLPGEEAQHDETEKDEADSGEQDKKQTRD